MSQLALASVISPPANGKLSVADRIKAIEYLASIVQTNVPTENKSERHKRVESALLSKGVVGAALFRVPDDYYGRRLNARAAVMNCPSAHLCKTIIFENSNGTITDNINAPIATQRYFGVLLQYISKLNVAALERFLGSEAKLAMAPLAMADAMTGFPHNGMTPFGSLTPFPIIVSKEITKVPAPAFIWLGGGEVGLGLRMFVSELMRPGVAGPDGYTPTVVDCTVPRGEDEDEIMSPVATPTPAATAAVNATSSAPAPTAPSASTTAEKKGKGGGKSSAAASPPSQQQPELPDVARIDLRVGHIVRAWPHPDSDKLWCEEVDVGEDKPRQIASGLRQYYPTVESMTGRRICVVCNLKPRPLAGFESQGMVLCASSADRSVVEFIDPPAGAKVGERLTVPGLMPSDAPFPVPEIVNPAKKNNPWVAVAPDLRTDGSRVACYKGVPLTTSAGPCTAPSQADAPIS